MSNREFPYNTVRNLTLVPNITGTEVSKKEIEIGMKNITFLYNLFDKYHNADALGILKFIGLTAVQSIPYAGGLLSAFYSKLMFRSSGTNYRAIWENIKGAVEELINQKITEAMMSLIMQEVVGLSAILDEYRKAYELYKGETVFQLAEGLTPADHLIQVFLTAHMQFVNRMPTFQNPKYDVVFLPFFVHAAEMHMILIKDGVLHGLEWGMSPEVHNRYKKLLKDMFKNYSAYLLEIYKKGLKEVEERELVNNDFPNAGFKNQYKNTVRWNVINEYKRGMTQLVFDFAYKWKYYQEDYVDNVSLNPMRTIFSDIDGAVYPYNTSTESIDNLVKTQNLKYKGLLKKLDIYNYHRIDSLQTTFEINGKDMTSDKVGGTGGKLDTIKIEPPTSNPLITVESWSELTPYALKFGYADDSETNLLGRTTYSRKYAKYQYTGNKVSTMIGFGKNKTTGFDNLDAMVVGFKNDDYSSQNILISTNEDGGKVTNVIEAGNYQEKDNFKLVEEPIFGDGVLNFTSFVSGEDGQKSVIYDIYTDTAGSYQLSIFIGQSNDRIGRFNVFVNNGSEKHCRFDTRGDGMENVSLISPDMKYMQVDVGKIELNKGLNNIRISNSAVPTPSDHCYLYLASLELTKL